MEKINLPKCFICFYNDSWYKPRKFVRIADDNWEVYIFFNGEWKWHDSCGEQSAIAEYYYEENQVFVERVVENEWTK